MTTIDASRQVHSAHSGGFILSAINALIAWNDNRVTRKALSTLTDRELDDIGLCRGDLEEITR